MQKKIKKILAAILSISIAFSGNGICVRAKQKLPKPVITKVYSGGKGQITVVYKKIASAKKYQVQISKDKKFKKGIKTKQAAKVKKIVFKGLTKGTYYVHMRSQYKVGKKNKYGDFSKVKKYVLNVKKKNDIKQTASPSVTLVPTSAPKPTNTPDKDIYDDWFWNDSTSKSTSKPEPTPNVTCKQSAAPTSDVTPTNTPSMGTSTPALINISSFYTKVNGGTKFYNGKEQCPEISVMDNYYVYLTKDIDYTVSYSNNINAGTANFCITGIGKYSGKINGTFEIQKIAFQNGGHIGKSQVIVGEAVDVVYDEKPEGSCIYEFYKHDSTDAAEGYVKVNENGQLIPEKTGIIDVKVSIAESQNYIASEYNVGTLNICNDEEPGNGLEMTKVKYRTGMTLKQDAVGSTVKDETATFSVDFYSEASDEWIDEHIKFEVEDVTPAGYKRAFEFADQKCTAPVLSVENITKEFCEESVYGRKTVNLPVSDDESDKTCVAMSARKLVITAGEGVRVCKVKVYVDDKLYDAGYLATRPYDENGKYLDEALYTKVRHKVEDRLWTDDMTNMQKLYKIANYICDTTHYPGKGCTDKDINPTFWNDFSVDGVELFYYLFDMPTLNRVMDLQGGITTCVAVSIVETVACDDLNLPYLYDRSTDTIADGEGVWMAVGSASSNPSAGSNHYSVIYKDAAGNKYFIDAQGIMSDTSCEEHGCLDKVLR